MEENKVKSIGEQLGVINYPIEIKDKDGKLIYWEYKGEYIIRGNGINLDESKTICEQLNIDPRFNYSYQFYNGVRDVFQFYIYDSRGLIVYQQESNSEWDIYQYNLKDKVILDKNHYGGYSKYDYHSNGNLAYRESYLPNLHLTTNLLYYKFDRGGNTIERGEITLDGKKIPFEKPITQ